MTDLTQPPVSPVRLFLDFGETVEVDGSTVYDPVASGQVPAVVLRMPRHRAAWLAAVLDAYTRVCRLASGDLNADEPGPAWALSLAASAAGHIDSAESQVFRRVTSARRLSAAALLRSAGGLDDVTVIAVVDAAARWVDDGGEEYAYALLGAVTDEVSQRRAYGVLLGSGGAS